MSNCGLKSIFSKILSPVLIGIFLPVFSTSAASFYSNDFNDGNVSPLGLQANVSIDQAGGVGNSPGLRVRYRYENRGTQGNAASLNVDSHKANEFWVKFDAKITGTPVGGSKFLKFFGAPCPNGHSCNNTTGIVDYYSNQQNRVVYYGDTLCEASYNGNDSGSCSPTHDLIYNPISLTENWVNLKYHYIRSLDGEPNGLWEVWKDGIKVVSISWLNNNPVGNFFSTHIEFIQLGGYTNGSSYSGGEDWSIWYDNVYVGSTDPDVVNDNSFPSAPGALAVW